MFDKTLFLLLFSLIYSQIINLTVFQLNGDNNITLDKSNGLICSEFHKDIQLNEYLYNNEEEGTKINKTIFYNLTELLCKDLNNLSIRFRQC